MEAGTWEGRKGVRPAIHPSLRCCTSNNVIFPLSLSFFVRECRHRMTRRNAAVVRRVVGRGRRRNINRRHTTTAETLSATLSDPQILFGQLLSDGRTPNSLSLPSFLGRCPCGAIDRISRLRPTLASPLASRQAQDFVFLCMVD